MKDGGYISWFLKGYVELLTSVTSASTRENDYV